MEEYNLSFCEEYEYPANIKKTFIKILDTIKYNNVLSIILIGSAARGELSYFIDNEKLKIYSDFEFFVITKRKVAMKKILSLNKNIYDIESSLQSSKLFHIDISFLYYKHLHNLPKKFQFLEAKKVGKVLYGPDLRHLIKDKVDLRDINESSIIYRLWPIIYYTPKNVFTQMLSKAEEEEIKYILARSVIDIPTWVLPHSNKYIFGIKERINFFKDNYNNLLCKDFLPKWFLNFLEECWIGKSKLKFNISYLELYEKTLICYINVIKYLFHLYKINNIQKENIDKILIKNSNRIFKEYIPRRKAFELLIIARDIKKFGIFPALSWFFLKKRGIAAAFLLNMNFSLLDYLKNGSNYNWYLSKAEEYIKKLYFNISSTKNLNFINKWLYLRKSYIDFLTINYRGFALKKDYLYKVIGEINGK